MTCLVFPVAAQQQHTAKVIMLLFKLATRVHMLLCRDTLRTKMSHWPINGEKLATPCPITHIQTLNTWVICLYLLTPLTRFKSVLILKS